jgi:hypothetical protein
MKKQSSQAQVAKIIKAELKKHSISCRTKSSSFAGGCSVDVWVTNQPPWVMEAIRSQTDKYEYGTFDSMTDCQGFKNRDFDGPQTKYLTITNEIDESIRLDARAFIESQVDVDQFDDYDLNRMTYDYLRTADNHFGCYFKKPVVKYAA